MSGKRVAHTALYIGACSCPGASPDDLFLGPSVALPEYADPCPHCWHLGRFRQPRPSDAPTHVLEYDTAAGVMHVNTPGGIRFATFDAHDLATIAHTVLGAALARDAGAHVPPVISFGVAAVKAPVIHPSNG